MLWLGHSYLRVYLQNLGVSSKVNLSDEALQLRKLFLNFSSYFTAARPYRRFRHRWYACDIPHGWQLLF